MIRLRSPIKNYCQIKHMHKAVCWLFLTTPVMAAAVSGCRGTNQDVGVLSSFLMLKILAAGGQREVGQTCFPLLFNQSTEISEQLGNGVCHKCTQQSASNRTQLLRLAELKDGELKLPSLGQVPRPVGGTCTAASPVTVAKASPTVVGSLSCIFPLVVTKALPPEPGNNSSTVANPLCST